MSFFEEIATALDADGIESRVNGETLFVPITSEVEIQFVEIDPHLPAANVYIATADGDSWDVDFEAVLVSVAFSVADAVNAVASHIATDQVVTVLNDLLEGTDERIADLDFNQDERVENGVFAMLTDNSSVEVTITIVAGVPTATVEFITILPMFETLMANAEEQIQTLGAEEGRSQVEIDDLIQDFANEALPECTERLELGTFTDFDKLFDVLSLAADQAESWSSQLVPLSDEDDEPDVYDIFGEDDDDEFFFLDEEDDEGDDDDIKAIDKE
ncbi:MAG: DNA primase [Corynebacterium sp.]|nr:DNA primase [Corynebacterium sp.]